MRVAGLFGWRPPVSVPSTYPARLRLLHWVTAILVVAQCALALTNALVYESRPVLAEAVVQAHLSIGAIILIVTILRLATRFTHPVPALPNGMSKGWKTSARSVHAALYLLLILLPITGYVKLAALGFEIAVFGLLPLPALPFDPNLAAFARMAHKGLAILLGAMVLGHVAAAVFHVQLFGSPVLHRMWPAAPKPYPLTERSVFENKRLKKETESI